MNGYFKVIADSKGAFLQLVAPTDGGEAVQLKEIIQYLNEKKIAFDLKQLNDGVAAASYDKPIFLSPAKLLPLSESCTVTIAEDGMSATARFYPAATNGRELNAEDIRSSCRLAGINFGIDEDVIADFLGNKQYCTDYTVAKGKAVQEGTDAVIEYFFNTDNKIRPTLKEDGTVDFFNLNLVNHCKKGDVLAKLTPAVRGIAGMSVRGEKVLPREVKVTSLQYGLNIDISEDKCTITSQVDGHVTLTGNKVFVSDVLTVTNVDNSTGNIEYDGTVVVMGNVNTNFSVKAKGDVEVKGAVEGAYIEAGGNILLSRGINGMGRAKIVAGGNIVAKFIENSTAAAAGYIDADAILHSNISAGTEVHVMSKKGFIVGGSVQATSKVCAKTLGSAMGADTKVAVGMDTRISARIAELNKEIGEIQKNMKTMLPVLDAAKKKIANGIKMTPDQVKNVQQLAGTVKVLQQKLENDTKELEELKSTATDNSKASVEVTGEVYPGTIIAISDLSMIVKTTYKYCRFIVEKGDVKLAAL